VSWLTALALSLPASLVVSAPALACKCMFPPVEAAREDASAVFEGRVLGIEDVDAGAAPSMGRRSITLSVVRTWKGLDHDERVTVYTNESSAACGYAFAKDTSYLVYARTSDDKQLHVSSCSRTKPLADASEDLTALGAGSTPVHIESKAVATDAGSAAPARVGSPSAASKPTKKKGCSVVHPSATGAADLGAWLLMVPGLLLMARRRRV
jgi:hypothetical protein